MLLRGLRGVPTVIKQVQYGFVQEKNFVGPENRQAVIAELLNSDDVGFDLTGFMCDQCGFIYSKPHPLGCEICEGAPEVV